MVCPPSPFSTMGTWSWCGVWCDVGCCGHGGGASHGRWLVVVVVVVGSSSVDPMICSPAIGTLTTGTGWPSRWCCGELMWQSTLRWCHSGTKMAVAGTVLGQLGRGGARHATRTRRALASTLRIPSSPPQVSVQLRAGGGVLLLLLRRRVCASARPRPYCGRALTRIAIASSSARASSAARGLASPSPNSRRR